MQRYLSRLWIALAILPLVAGAALASGPAMFVCRDDSIARANCCCPQSQHRVASAHATPALSATCCCDTTQINAPAAPAIVEPRAVPPFAYATGLAPALGAPGIPWAPNIRPGPAALLAQPPPSAAPILLSKQAFLI